MKNVQTQLAKSVLLSLELTAEASASDSSINNNKSWFENNSDNFKRRNERYQENI